MTSVMGEVFNAIKQNRRLKRAGNYKKALERFEIEGWSKYTDMHWYKYIDGIVDRDHLVVYWPSSNKYLYQGEYYYGNVPRELRILIHGR